MIPEVFFDLGGVVIFIDTPFIEERSRVSFIDKLNFLLSHSKPVERAVSLGVVAFKDEWKYSDPELHHLFYDDLKYFRPVANAATILVDCDYLEF